MGPEAAAVSSLASLGFQAGGSVLKGMGDSATQDFLAERDKRNAEIGRLRGEQTDVAEREQLNTTIANIESIRAAAEIDPTSPTSAAIIANETRISDRERQIRVAALNAQAGEDDASASYRRSVGESALLNGYLGGAATLVGGLGKAYARR